MSLQDIFMCNLKKYRKNAGLTQEKLAELCSSDPCYIRQIEIGRRFPSVTFIEKIASALNIMPYLLFYEESEAESAKRIFFNNTQKEKIKSMLIENTKKICMVIDEQC